MSHFQYLLLANIRASQLYTSFFYPSLANNAHIHSHWDYWEKIMCMHRTSVRLFGSFLITGFVMSKDNLPQQRHRLLSPSQIGIPLTEEGGPYQVFSQIERVYFNLTDKMRRGTTMNKG